MSHRVSLNPLCNFHHSAATPVSQCASRTCESFLCLPLQHPVPCAHSYHCVTDFIHFSCHQCVSPPWYAHSLSHSPVGHHLSSVCLPSFLPSILTAVFTHILHSPTCCRISLSSWNPSSLLPSVFPSHRPPHTLLWFLHIAQCSRQCITPSSLHLSHSAVFHFTVRTSMSLSFILPSARHHSVLHELALHPTMCYFITQSCIQLIFICPSGLTYSILDAPIIHPPSATASFSFPCTSHSLHFVIVSLHSPCTCPSSP